MKQYIERKVVKIFFMIFIFYITGCSIVYASEKPEIFAQLGHSGSITSVTFSPDGRYIASGSSDKTLKLWDSSTGREIRTFIGHNKAIETIAFSPDGKYIASGSEDKTIKVWEVSTNREIKSFTGHEDWITSLAFSPDGKYFVSGSYDKTLKIWEISTGNEMKTLKGHEAFVNDVNFSPDGQYIVSGSSDKTIKLWEVSTGREIRTFKGHTHLVLGVLFSPDGKYIVSGSEDKAIKLWEVSTGDEIKTLKGHTAGVNSVSFSPDGKYIVSGSNDKTIKLWEVSTGREIRTFKGHSGLVPCVIFSPDGKYIASGSHDKTLKLWEVSTGDEIKTFKGHTAGVHSVSFSPDGKYIVSGSAGSTINLWDTLTGKEIRTFKGHTDQIKAVTFSPDGKFVSSGSEDKTIRIWDVSTGKEMRILKGHTKYINSTAFSPDGRYLVSGGADKIIKLWDVIMGNEVKAITGHKGNIISLTFSPDGKYIASGGISSKKNFKLWEVSTGNEVRAFRENYGVRSVIFSPNGKLICSAGQVGALKLWDAATGKEIRKFVGHTGWVFSASFSSDGNNIASGSEDKTIKLWDALTGKEIMTFKGCLDEVHSVAFAPSNRYITSGSRDGTTRLWDASTGKELAKFITFTDGEWIVITPEGYFNASPNGAKHLNVRIGNTVYGIDQFYAKFYRPELVQLALAGKATPKTVTLAEIASQKPAPTVHIISPASGSSIDKDNITVSLKITDNQGGIGNVMLYLNGSLVANETRAVIIKGKEAANEKMMSFTVPLIEGKNEIRVIAFNKENSMESNPALVSIISRAVLHKPNLYALVVGINEYKNKSISLNYAVPDAKAFGETLKRTGAPLFEKIDIQVLTTPAETTRESITRAFEALRVKIKPNDLFVFYNSSHGTVDVVDNEEQYFLLTSNVLLLSSRHIGKDAMSQKELAKVIGNIPAQKKVVILDTCNAGKGGREIQVALLQQTRGLTDSTAVKLLQRAIGSAVFSASSDTQLALEGYKGHGLFTYVLLEGLKGKADIKKDGYITVLGLADYVEENVLKLSEEVFKRQQTPTIQTGANFPIGKVR